LVNQKTGARQGNINTILYPLATLASTGGAQIFHSITGGNNSVPGVTGFSAGPHYNQATGLGSPDAFVLVNHWKDASTAPPTPPTPPTSPSTPSLSLSATPSLTLARGAHGAVAVATSVSGGFNSAVALSISGLPSGVTASFAPASFAAPGAGASTLTITASSSAAVGSYALTIGASGANLQKAASLTLTIAPPFTVAPSATSVAIAHGTSAAVTISTTAASGFSGSITLAAQPPAGITATFGSATIAAPGTGSAQLTISVASNATAGTYIIPITATSGSIVATTSVSVVVTAPATFALKATPSTVSITQGTSGSTTLSIASVGNFAGAVTVSYSAPPSGVTAKWSSVSGGAELTFTASSSADVGSFPITITGISSGVSPSPTTVVTLIVAR